MLCRSRSKVLVCLVARRNLGQPDHRLCGFHLAEEQGTFACRVAPMRQQAGGFISDAPLISGEVTPSFNTLTDAVDQIVGSGVGAAFDVVGKFLLARYPPSSRNGNDIGARSSILFEMAGRHPLG